MSITSHVSSRTAFIAIWVQAPFCGSKSPVSKSSTIPTKTVGSLFGVAIIKVLVYNLLISLNILFSNSSIVPSLMMIQS
ncbi:hypothetical protein DXB85_03410 [Parabacteroides merdae]|nr:hypothetical protein DXB85_03410 [Parabacteroides merdae]